MKADTDPAVQALDEDEIERFRVSTAALARALGDDDYSFQWTNLSMRRLLATLVRDRLAIAGTERVAALEKAAAEVWHSVPGTYDYDDPMVQRHAKALNALGAIVEEYAPFARAALTPKEPTDG